MSQPIIRGIQAVGAVDIMYEYNGNGGLLKLPSTIKLNKNPTTVGGAGESQNDVSINTVGGVPVCGYRLDGEFLRAVQQIASSVQVPILGGGAVALTNNNRSGSLTINCTKVSTPNGTVEGKNGIGAMYRPSGSKIGANTDNVYDLVFLSQAQQAQVGGDSEGATITIYFKFCGLTTAIEFQGCTIANVDPLGLSGNDAVNYGVQINYLNWEIEYNVASRD